LNFKKNVEFFLSTDLETYLVEGSIFEIELFLLLARNANQANRDAGVEQLVSVIDLAYFRCSVLERLPCSICGEEPTMNLVVD
jgi:hypothetical protein